MARIASCKTQKDVYEACGIPQSTYAHIEIGKYVPETKIITNIADYLCIKQQWLEFGTGSPFTNKEKIIILNKCRERKNEEQAIELIKIEHPKKGLSYIGASCVLFRRHQGNYVILNVSDPHDSADHEYVFDLEKRISTPINFIDLDVFIKIDNFEEIDSLFSKPVLALDKELDEKIARILQKLSLKQISPDPNFSEDELEMNESAKYVLINYLHISRRLKEAIVEIYEKLSGKDQ